MKRAQYIAFEGIDGSGKTKQIDLLQKFLEQQGYSVLLTREFGSLHNDACVSIRDFALNSKHNIDEIAGQFMFAACSSQHNEKVIAPNMDRYDFILSDRSIESNLAYCTSIGIDRDFAHTLFFLDKRRIHPDKIVYLDVDPEISWKRVSKRTQEKFTDGGSDRIEDKGLEFQKRVHAEYARRQQENSRYIVVNSQETIQQTHHLVLKSLGLVNTDVPTNVSIHKALTELQEAAITARNQQLASKEYKGKLFSLINKKMDDHT